MSSPSAYLDILKILVTPGYYLPSEELKEHFQTVVSKYVENSELAEFTPIELEMYARYRKGEAIEDICESLGCTIKEFEQAKSDLEKDDHISNLAVAWFEREQQLVAEEQERQQKRIAKEERLEYMIQLRVSDNLSDEKIGNIVGLTKARVNQIFKQARLDGYDVPRRRKAKSESQNGNNPFGEKVYKMDKKLQEKNPNSTQTWRVEEIARRTERRKELIRRILSEELHRRGETRPYHHIPSEIWELVEHEVGELIQLGETKENACKIVSDRRNINASTIYSHLADKGLYTASKGRNRTAEETKQIISVIERLCSDSFTRQPTTFREILRSASNILGIHEGALQSSYYSYKAKTGYKTPPYNAKSKYNKKYNKYNAIQTYDIIAVVEKLCYDSFSEPPTTYENIIRQTAEILEVSESTVKRRLRKHTQETGYKHPPCNAKHGARLDSVLREIRDKELFDEYCKRQQAAGYELFAPSPIIQQVANDSGYSKYTIWKIVKAEQEKAQHKEAEGN